MRILKSSLVFLPGLYLPPHAPVHPRVYVSLIQDFIHKCSRGHAVCRERPQQSVKDLRFIDCQTRRIVAAPGNAEYFSLSYTWGKGYTPLDYAQQLQTTLLATIADAISITERLGRRYLWIDR